MIIYRVLSALLSYPEQELIDALPELEAVLAPTPRIRAQLGPLIEHLRTTKLIRLQEEYVAEFDRSRRQSLYLFEHIHGESRERGDALLDLLREYQRHGFEPCDEAGSPRETPDYLPLFLEFLAGRCGARDRTGGQSPGRAREPVCRRVHRPAGNVAGEGAAHGGCAGT